MRDAVKSRAFDLQKLKARGSDPRTIAYVMRKIPFKGSVLRV